MHPIPPHPNGHAIGSEEVVPSASELPIDVKSATRAVVDLVPKLKVLIPGTTVGACLGCAWFTALVDVSPRVAGSSIGQALTKEPMPPRIERPCKLGSKLTPLAFFCEPSSL